MSFRQCYPTIEEQVAPSLEFSGQFDFRDVWSLKQRQDALVVNPNVLDHFYRGDHFEATYDLGTKDDL